MGVCWFCFGGAGWCYWANTASTGGLEIQILSLLRTIEKHWGRAKFRQLHTCFIFQGKKKVIELLA